MIRMGRMCVQLGMKMRAADNKRIIGIAAGCWMLLGVAGCCWVMLDAVG